MNKGDSAQEEAVIERASALARAGSGDQAVTVLREYVSAHPRAQAFLLNAGKALHDAGEAGLAVPFLEESLALRSTPQAADRLFVCYHRLRRMDDAVRVLTVLAAGGNYRAALRRDFAGALRRTEAGSIAVAKLHTLIRAFADDIVVGPSLLPHLIAAGHADVVIRIAGNGAIDPHSWDEDLVLQTVDALHACGRDDLAMRVMCRCGGHSVVFLRRLGEMLEGFSPAQLADEILPLLKPEEGRASAIINPEPYFEIARRLAQAGNYVAELETLTLLAHSLDRTTAFRAYARQRERIGEIVQSLLERGEHKDAVSFALCWLDPALRRFFAGPDLQRLILQLETAQVRKTAAATSRIGVLREGYFRHHMERRESRRVPSSPSDAELRSAALAYFQTVSHALGADAIPVSRELSNRLPALLLRDAPDAWTFLQKVVTEKSIPSSCIPAAAADEFYSVASHKSPGVNVTKFAERFCASNEALRTTLDPANALDSLFLFLHLVAGPLARHTQYLPFVAPMVPERSTPEFAFLERCLSALTAESPDMGIVGEHILAALAGEPPIARRPAVVRDAPQDVLLVGHAGKSTGLGRNFQMLASALRAMPRIAVRELDYESDVREIGRSLSEWRRSCRTRPIVLYAVNAQDVPAILLKDGRGELADAYAAGFFLWETSRVPDVQRLGIALVDEVWTPANYVRAIYAPLAPTHLVGKGLFDTADRAPPANERRTPNNPFRFVTVFDFDSSIERKNPLAVVRAFQQAFSGGEKVELVVKGSSIKPEHWSNALGHWEQLSAAMAGDARIRLVTERYSDAEMEALLRGADCFVSLHRAEGFGYVIADAMTFGVPVIATDYSGNADFCTPETSFPVAAPIIAVDPRVMQWNVEGAEWADPDVDAAAARMREVHADYALALQIAGEGRAKLISRYGMDAFRKAIIDRIASIRAAC